jgi:hypothetical protein
MWTPKRKPKTEDRPKGLPRKTPSLPSTPNKYTHRFEYQTVTLDDEPEIKNTGFSDMGILIDAVMNRYAESGWGLVATPLLHGNLLLVMERPVR